MADWSELIDAGTLAGMSRGGNVLERMGYDPEEMRADPVKRAAMMREMGGPGANYGAQIGRQQQDQPASAPNSPGPQPVAGQPQTAAQPNPAVASATPARPQVTGAAGGAAPAANPATGSGPGLDQIGLEALQRGMGLGEKAQAIGEDLAGSTGPDTTALEAQRVKDATPTPYRDPETGQVYADAQQYKPGVMTRIARGLEAAHKGGLAGVFDPPTVGATPYGAPNQNYQTAEAARTSRLASDDQQLGNVRDQFKAMVDARAKGAGEMRQGVTAFNDVAKGVAELTRADTDANTRKDNSPEGVAALDEAKFKELNSQADRLGLKGQMRVHYVGNNGHLPDPKQPTSEDTARAEATKAFVKQYGRYPATLDEINQVNSAAGGRLKDASDDPQVSAIVADATGKKQEFVNGYEQQPDGSYLKKGASKRSALQKEGDVIDAKTFHDKVDQFRLDANKQLDKHGAMIDGTGQVVKNSGAAGHLGGAAAPNVAVPAGQLGGAGAPNVAVPAGQLGGAGAPNVAVPAGRVAVSVPRGGTYHFPNQKAADAFKKQAGIQ